MLAEPCPHCQQTVKIQDRLIGKRVRCPKCKEAFQVDEPVELELVEPAGATGQLFGLTRNGQWTAGLILGIAGAATLIAGAVIFFGRSSIAEVFLGARFLFGQVHHADADKVTIVAAIGLAIGFIGLLASIAGVVLLAHHYAAFWASDAQRKSFNR